MRAVKCKVTCLSDQWPLTPKQYPVISVWDAALWINEIGFCHVASGTCNLVKCQSALKYIEDGQIVKSLMYKDRPVIKNSWGWQQDQQRFAKKQKKNELKSLANSVNGVQHTQGESQDTSSGILDSQA